LAIDPAWIRDYPDEIELVRRFTPEIRVLPDPYDPELTRKAQQLAAQIAQHFELVGRQGLVASTSEFLSQLQQSAEDERRFAITKSWFETLKASVNPPMISCPIHRATAGYRPAWRRKKRCVLRQLGRGVR
jgi:hypothetical protein